MGRSSLLVEKAQGSTLFGTKGSTKKGFFRIMSKIGDPPPTPWVHLGRQMPLVAEKVGFSRPKQGFKTHFGKFRTPTPSYGTKLI